MRSPLRRSALPVLLTTVTLLVAVPVGQASAAVTYTGTLAGPSIAQMYPSGLEYDDVNDRIVVADTGLDKVQFYTVTGTKLGEFGTHGTGDGQFDSPRDAAVDEVGNIYIADAGNNRVQAFTSAGSFLWSRGGTGTCNTCLNTPIGVTWDAANDQLLIASTGQDLIKSFTAAGDWVWTSPPIGTGSNQIDIDAPRDVTRGPDGRVWVSDYDQHFIKAFNVTPAGVWTNTPAVTLGGPGSGDGQLNFPYNVDFSLDGTLAYVSDTGHNKVQTWNIAGPSPVFVENIGGDCPETPEPCADPPADFGFIDTLRRVVVTETGELMTADFWGNGMQVWEADGDPIREIALQAAPAPGFAQAFGVATAPNGDVYVMDRLNQRMQRFSSTGAFISQAGSRGTSPGKLSWPEAIAVGPDGTVWAGDTRGDQVQRWPANLSSSPAPKEYPANPASGSAVGKFNYIEDLDVAPNGDVYVADTNNNRIQYFTPPSGTNPATFTAIGGPTTGTVAGQFDHPQGVAVSSSNIFVADTGNDRIQKLSLTGAPLLSYSTGLNGPEGIALAPDGTLWVADTNDNEIVHLSANLTPINDGFGGAGTGNMQFNLPHTLAVSANKLYVADTFNNRVQIFDTGAAGPDTTAPGVAITVPTTSQVFPNAPITFSGTATDNIGVSTVKVAIKDTARPAGQNWWRLTGTTWGWGAYQLLTATLGTPGGTSTNWTYNWTPPSSGSYSVLAEASDAALNVTPAPKPTVLFSVSQGGPTDTTAPTVAISVPTTNQVFPNGPVAFSGTAADNVGVATVKVAIKDLGRPNGSNWWRSNGTWGAFQQQTATLGTPNGTSTTWSYNWTPPTTAGSYSLQLDASDAASNVAATPKPTKLFSVQAGGGGNPTLNATYNRQVSNNGGIAPLYPAGGATDTNGDRYIADSGGSRIVKITAAGVQSTISDVTNGWNDPRDLEFDVTDPNSLWVADTSDSQIVKMTKTGTIVSTFGGTSAFATPYGLANDATGVYVADTYNNRVQKISKTDGSVLWTQTTCSGTTFSRPRDVGVGSDGNVYVADTDRDRIVRLNPTTGACILAFGTAGAGNAQFNAPRSLTSDGNGGLWIADAGNNRLKRHSNSGTFIGQAGVFGQNAGAPPQFRSAHCVFLDGNKVDVCDTFNYRIQQFSVNAQNKPFWSATIGGTRPANGGFNGAFDVAYAPDGSMYAVDWFNHRIQKFNAAGVFQLEFGGYSSKDGSLIFPRGVAVASNGNVVVMDSENNRIDIFNSSGVFQSKIKPPTGQTQFLRPHQVAIASDGTYWVADTGNDRIVHINSAGTVLHSWNGGGLVSAPRGVAVDAAGNVYVSSTNNKVEKYTTTGTLISTLATNGTGPTNVKGSYGLRITGTGSNAMLMIADAGNNRVVVMTLDGIAVTTFGATGSGNGQMSSPRGMDRNPLTGEISVADFLNNRLSIWTATS